MLWICWLQNRLYRPQRMRSIELRTLVSQSACQALFSHSVVWLFKVPECLLSDGVAWIGFESLRFTARVDVLNEFIGSSSYVISEQSQRRYEDMCGACYDIAKRLLASINLRNDLGLQGSKFWTQHLSFVKLHLPVYYIGFKLFDLTSIKSKCDENFYRRRKISLKYPKEGGKWIEFVAYGSIVMHILVFRFFLTNFEQWSESIGQRY